MSKTRPTKSSIDERIKLLERQSEELREAIDHDFEETKNRAVKIAKMALIVGGGVVISMIVLNSLFGRRDEEHGEEVRPRVYHRFRDQFGQELSSRAALFFLKLAQEKLRDYVRPNTEEDENPEPNPGK